jgi:hypothetical protein
MYGGWRREVGRKFSRKNEVRSRRRGELSNSKLLVRLE